MSHSGVMQAALRRAAIALVGRQAVVAGAAISSDGIFTGSAVLLAHFRARADEVVQA